MSGSGEGKLYVIVDWDDGTSTDIPLSCIKTPRKEVYEVGERVTARLPQMGIFNGVIAAIDEDRDWLVSVITGPRPVPPKTTTSETKVHHDSDSDRRKASSSRKSQPQEKQKPVKRKLPITGLNADDPHSQSDSDMSEAAKKIELKMKREKAAARQKTMALASKALQDSDSENCTPRKKTKMTEPLSAQSSQILMKINSKVDFISNQLNKCLNAINGLRSCRGCAKKMLKSFEDPPQSPGDSSSASNQVVSPSADSTSPYTAMASLVSLTTESNNSISKVSNTGSFKCKVCQKYFMTKFHLDVHVSRNHQDREPDRKDNQAIHSEDANLSDSGLTYIGSAKYGIKINKIDLDRCHASAKNLNKLALNLIEFVVSDELVKAGVSIYGNSQFKLAPLPESLVHAFRGHLFHKYPAESANEEERLWIDLVPRLNHKLKNLRKGKYASFSTETLD